MNIDIYCANYFKIIMVYFSEAFLFSLWRTKACIFRLLPMEAECQHMCFVIFLTNCDTGELGPTWGSGWSWWRWPPADGVGGGDEVDTSLRNPALARGKGPASFSAAEGQQCDPMPYWRDNQLEEQAVWSLVVSECWIFNRHKWFIIGTIDFCLPSTLYLSIVKQRNPRTKIKTA